MASDAHGLNATVSDWNTDLFSSDFLDLDFSSSEDAPFSRNVFEPAEPFPSSTGENFLVRFWQTIPDTQSAQAIGQNAFSSLPGPPGVSSFHPQFTVTPVDIVARDWNPDYEGVTGEKLWLINAEHPSALVPAIPPPVPSSSLTTIYPANWTKVPQRSYNQGSKQLGFTRLEPICFSTTDHPGISLGDALRKKFANFHGQGDPMLQGLSGSISCRLLFPGYPDNGSSCQIHVQDWTKARRPIPRSKLAYEVAKKVNRYLTHLTRIVPDGTVDGRWRVGQGFMHIGNMFLVSLESVSRGSFQPEIWVNPSVPRVTYGDGY